MTGIDLIAQERERQMSSEGYDSRNDDAYRDGQLEKAAIAYLVNTVPCGVGDGRSFWPWKKEFWKPRDKKANLVRAGALIAAALDRVIRDEIRDATDVAYP